MADEAVHHKAAAIERFLKKNPEATVDEIAGETDLTHDEVVEVLDTHFVDEAGKLENKGAGQGGGWHPARLREAEEQKAADEAAATQQVEPA